MRRVAAALVALWTSAAYADPVVHAGAQPAPPVPTSEPVLAQELDGRRHVRGCAVGETCTQDVLREFELERFPPPGANPWISERAPAPSRLEANRPRFATRPSELRPDAPWLDDLELPDLPVKWSQRLVDYLVFYRDDPRGRAIMSGWLVAQGRYKDMILAHLRKAKLPEDLLYVAMIESSYDPDTLSRAGALGLWQWMPEGAKIYGLRRDRWVDERKDPYRSTIAQMDYFRDLYQRFGDWHIALAAFNAGYGGILRSIARYNTNDYYQLCAYENAIAWETCWYTPKVLATAIVGRNRAAFGFDKLEVAPAERWDDIAVPTSVSIGVIARAAGVDEAAIKRLNPHLRQDRTPPGDPGYIVRVPAGTRVASQRRLAELQSDWDGYDAYVVAHGERVEDVATTFGLSTYALKKLNGITHESEVEGGTVLVVPRISEAERAKNRAKARADLHTSGVDQREGEQLLVPVLDKDAVIAGKRRVFYRVVSGDSLRSVANALDLRARELAMWNGLEPEAKLHPRMVLVAWVPDAFDADARNVALLDERHLIIVTRGSPEHLDLAEARMGRVRTEYVAGGKEKLGDIAKKFGMTAHDLARINRISYNTVLAKGDTVIVYQVTDPKRSERAEAQWKKTPKKTRGKIVLPKAETTATAQRETAKRETAKRETAKREDDDAKDTDSNTKRDTRPKTAAKPAPKQTAEKPKAEPAKPKGEPAKATSEPAKPKAEPTKSEAPSTRESNDKGARPAAAEDPRESAPASGPVTNPTQLD